METPGVGRRRLLSLANGEKPKRILGKMLDEKEFLGPYGIRSLSRVHAEHPYIFAFGGQESRVDYEPDESNSFMFGGNSKWRGPVWFPLNFLIVEALQKFHYYLGNDFKQPVPPLFRIPLYESPIICYEYAVANKALDNECKGR